MIPFLATVSIGVITALGIALGIVGALRALSSMKLNRKVVLIITSIFLVLAAVVALNAEVIFTRVIAILTGEDGSTNMRTIGSMDVAYQIMKEKSTWFGIGPGQIKITGKEIFNSYFNYQDSNVPRIPNAIGETMTTFGFIGLAIRLIIQFLIFIQFRVYKNNYLLSLFLFLFIYQFTGSFITSTIEYVFWLLLTIPVFKEFKHD
ncbi:MAG: O-antigen ligase family protein [Jejuia sp.]